MTSLGDADAQEGRLQGGPGGRQVGGLVEPGFQCSLRFATGLLGLLQVDLASQIGGLRHHHDLVRSDLDEPTRDGE